MKMVLLYLGKCSSTSKQRNPNSDSVMKIGHSVTGQNRAVAGPNLDDDTITVTGSKEEAFYDSQVWLESDSEDFFSVQGENAPSLKTSPVHQKKSLSDLLCESFDSTKLVDQSVLLEGQESPDKENPVAAVKLQRRKASGSGRHCLPGLVRSISCSEWKKKRPSPVLLPCLHCISWIPVKQLEHK